ncbi:hypothetical protein D3C73_1180310 [compost metagenome]
MRRHEQPLIEPPGRSEHRPYFAADSRRGQPVGCQFYEVAASADITAGLGNPAPRVLDQRAGYQICTDLRRLKRFGKFAVAVIHEHD